MIPGNTKTLWNAVKSAKDVNTDILPKIMCLEGKIVDKGSLPDIIAVFFDKKVKQIVSSIACDDTVYNGKKKVEATDKMFMDIASIRECITTLKTKNSEGFDRIPQRILVDGIDQLIIPLAGLFKLIYESKQIPSQWLIAKVIPLHKKGAKKDIENYRPISNLCSTSKIFEKLILKRIHEIQVENNIDMTGKNQHGFKKGKST